MWSTTYNYWIVSMNTIDFKAWNIGIEYGWLKAWESVQIGLMNPKIKSKLDPRALVHIYEFIIEFKHELWASD